MTVLEQRLCVVEIQEGCVFKKKNDRQKLLEVCDTNKIKHNVCIYNLFNFLGLRILGDRYKKIFLILSMSKEQVYTIHITFQLHFTSFKKKKKRIMVYAKKLTTFDDR